MKLIPVKTRIVVKTHENSDGYECDHEYVFVEMSETKKFVSGEFATDAYGICHMKSYYETITEISEQTEYEINYD